VKITLGIVAGITLSIIAYAMKQPTLDMIFMRNPPETHPDCKPRYWNKHAGVITREPWT